MKKRVVSKCVNFIKRKNKYSVEELTQIEYGLEGIYLTISKLIIIAIIAILLGILKEMLIYMLIYNILRIPSFGLHATKSWMCLLATTILFIGIPFLCLYLTIPLIIKILIGIVCTIFMYKNSPADTKKRPIVNYKRRKTYKIISTILTIIFAITSNLINNQFISNCLVFSMIMQNFMISPTVYKIFRLPYNNYITFLKEHPDFIE